MLEAKLTPRSLAVDLILTPYSVLYLSLHNLSTLAPILTAYLPPFFAFATFIKLNGGIVLGKLGFRIVSSVCSTAKTDFRILSQGDKSNHVATIHVPQLYYFISFSAAFLSPHLLEKNKIRKSVSSLVGTKKSVTSLCYIYRRSADWREHLYRRVAASLNYLVVMCWTIRNFTSVFFPSINDLFESELNHYSLYSIAHPFLLADNRHFAFYLWRRVINVHPLARYALTPGYLFAARLIYQALSESASEVPLFRVVLTSLYSLQSILKR